MRYKGVIIYRENGWYKADIKKPGLVGWYIQPIMADTLDGIKQFIRGAK